MATKYIVTATANHDEKPLSNPKSARATAEKRSIADNETVYVKTAATGKIVETFLAPKPEPKKAAPKAAGKTTRREALRPSAVPTWDVLYDKPKQNAQVVRKYVEGKAVYALLCTTHTRLRQLTRLTQERTLRANGGWCAKCTAEAAK